MERVTPEERARALATAKGFEKAGQHDKALDCFKRLDAEDEVIRLLASLRRYAEGATYLVERLPPLSGNLSGLPREDKRRVLNAAVLLGKAGDTKQAVQLLVGIDERLRAAELLERAGDSVGAQKLRGHAPAPLPGASAARPGGKPAAGTLDGAAKLEAQGKLDAALQVYVHARSYGNAGRVAAALGRAHQAAQLYLDASMPYEAATQYVAAGDAEQALKCFARVPTSEPRYRDICHEAVRLALSFGKSDLQFEYFLAPFLSGPPKSDKDCETLYQLAQLYERQEILENSREVLDKLLRANPGFKDAAAWRKRLETRVRGEVEKFRKVVEQDAAFQDVGQLPDLPDLPPLPARSAPVRAMTVQETEDEEAHGKTISRAPVPPQPPPPAPQPPQSTVSEAPRPAPETPLRGFQLGGLLAGRYRLERKLGQGGMGIVFQAHDQELSEDIALKIFTQPADEAALARFKQELKLARKLQHANIVRLFDFGVAEGHHFITMELLAGAELRAELGRPMELRRAMSLLMQSCAGLHAAHTQGVVHRDVKPENLFVTTGGTVKVMDFGIAKGQNAQGMTVSGTVAGTPEYMSPEQINNFSTVTRATDLYSLGVVAYEMFTGEVPFRHAELMPLLMMHLSQLPTPPRQKNPALSETVERIILKCLAKNPAERFPDCRELAAACNQALTKG